MKTTRKGVTKMKTTKRLYLMLGRDGYPIHHQGWELIEIERIKNMKER